MGRARSWRSLATAGSRPGTWSLAEGTGRFATGDLVARGGDGLFRLAGRKKSVIISGGRNIFPEEVDAALVALPGVLEAATVGVPDEIWGERVEACVVLSDPDAAVEPLLVAVAEVLADYKRPRVLHVEGDLPRSGAAGKVDRAAVLERLVARGGQREAPLAEDLEGRVYGIAARCFQVPAEQLNRSTTPEHVHGWDSLAHLRLVEALEGTFGVRVRPLEVTRITSLGVAIDLMRSKLDAGRS